MPLIEELPVTGPTRISHGWAYVPDTGPIAAMVQPGSRKRNRNDAGTTNATATAKQQKAIQQRLESLDKENYKDGVTVPIPARTGSAAKEGKSGKKMTSNVRRILTYQRTFQHYLADEEAGLSSGTTTTSTATTQGSTPRTDARRKNAIEPTTAGRRGGRDKTQDTRRESGAGSMQPPARPRRSSVKQEDVTMTGTSDAAADDTASQRPSQASPSKQLASTSISKTPKTPSSNLDKHPLLRTLDLPKIPSDRVMQALVSEPPLSYLAARATVSEEAVTGKPEKPPRHFCALCGYWGKVKCRKCGEWTCGLMECWKGHEGVCVALGMY